MSTATEPPAARKVPLSRAQVLRAAVDLADADGLDGLTMRRLAERSGVEVMSLYYHVANKDAVLDGLVEVVFAEIETATGGYSVPPVDPEWHSALRSRILAARAVMLRHRWAPAVLESRSSVGLAVARYVDSVVGTLRSGGFSFDQIHHALHALGSRAFGFSQELLGDDSGGETDPATMASMAAATPFLTQMMTAVAHDDPESTLGWCDDQFEFEYGLDIVLDGIERRRTPIA